MTGDQKYKVDARIVTLIFAVDKYISTKKKLAFGGSEDLTTPNQMVICKLYQLLRDINVYCLPTVV